jgi:hypothetical protein
MSEARRLAFAEAILSVGSGTLATCLGERLYPAGNVPGGTLVLSNSSRTDRRRMVL